MIWDEALELPQEAALEDYFREIAQPPLSDTRLVDNESLYCAIITSSGCFPIRQMQQVLARSYLIVWEEALPAGHLTNPGSKTPIY
jgi:hypothetical protein